jgi:hypothetical protein
MEAELARLVNDPHSSPAEDFEDVISGNGG